MNTQKLVQEQLRLAGKIMTSDLFEDINYIAACDQSYNGNEKVFSVIVVLDAKTMKVIDKASAEMPCALHYMPGFLFYREAPAIIEAFTKLKIRPDLLMVDGNGILHPRRIGMASQLGIALDIPTIGIAKSLMMGKISDDGKIEVEKEIRAEEVRTKEFAKPLYVSPGHRISLRTAVDIVRKMMIAPHKLPEPLHIAHRLAKKTKESGETKGASENDSAEAGSAS